MPRRRTARTGPGAGADRASVGPGHRGDPLRVSPEASNELLEANAALQGLAYEFALADDQDAAEARLAKLREIQAGVPTAIRAGTTALPGHERRAPPELARRAAHVASADGAMPLRRLQAQALLRREPRRDRLHGREGSEPHCRSARHVRRSAGHDLRQPRHLRAFGLLLGPAADGVPARSRALRRTERRAHGRPHHGRPGVPLGRAQLRARRRRGARTGRPRAAPAIEVSKDGPYRITGTIPLEDADGNPELRNEGVSLEHYSLCRCGQSRNKPFCSGRHWDVSFRDPVSDPDAEPTLFEWAGGFPALTRMTRIFYGKYVPQDPLLLPSSRTCLPIIPSASPRG